MPSPKRYSVELRNRAGATLNAQVVARTLQDAMELAAERHPGYRALSAREDGAPTVASAPCPPRGLALRTGKAGSAHALV